MVGSATRNARATWVVDRPPSSRRVSATCAWVESAGWQQVKMSRSRSSGTAPWSSAMSGSWSPGQSAATSPRSSRPRDSRRSRSMARLRAVVVIQPPGLGGRPSAGHLSRATANASWTASSARSMSPTTRIRVATDRPDSWRKIRPTSAWSRVAGASPSPTRSGLGGGERPDLDRLADRRRGLGRPDQRRVQVLGLDDVEAAQVLPRLHEGPVGGHHLAVRDTHHRGRVRFVQPAGEQPGPGRLQLLVQELDLSPGLLHLLIGHRVAGLAVDAVDRQQVLRRVSSSCWAGTSRRSPPLRTGPAQIDTRTEETPAAAASASTTRPSAPLSGLSRLLAGTVLFARSTIEDRSHPARG